jgi:hypothetical protein
MKLRGGPSAMPNDMQGAGAGLHLPVHGAISARKECPLRQLLRSQSLLQKKSAWQS